MSKRRTRKSDRPSARAARIPGPAAVGDIDSGDIPAWRWCMVEDLYDGGLESKDVKGLDPLVRKALKFLWQYAPFTQGDPHPVGIAKLKEQYPAIYRAHKLWCNFDNRMALRWFVEAGLLAGRDYEQVSEYLGIPKDVVEAYHDLFFDVGPHLKDSGWIVSRVLMPAVQHGMIVEDYDLLWKSVAYCGGWNVLFDFWLQDDMVESSEEWFAAAYKRRMLRKGWLAAATMPVNRFTSVDIVKTCSEIINAAREVDSAEERGIVETKLVAFIQQIGTQIAVLDETKQLPAKEPGLLLIGDIPEEVSK